MSTSTVTPVSAPVPAIAPEAQKSFKARAGELKDRVVSEISSHSSQLKALRTGVLAVAALVVGAAAIYFGGAALVIAAIVLGGLTLVSGISMVKECREIRFVRSASKELNDKVKLEVLSREETKKNAPVATPVEKPLALKHKIARATGFVAMAAASAYVAYQTLQFPVVESFLSTYVDSAVGFMVDSVANFNLSNMIASNFQFPRLG